MLERILLATILTIFFALPLSVHAQEDDVLPSNARAPFFIRLDEVTIAKGYTVSTPDDSLKLSLVPGILSESSPVLIEEIPTMDMPWRLERISPVFQFEFMNKSAYRDAHPFYVQFQTSVKTNRFKQVFFYDKTYDAWRPLPTQDFPSENFVRSLIHLPYARIAVFAYPDALGSGDASWYAHKPGMYAASPDFPKGSLIRVHNLENGAFVDVTINDYGPDRSRFPGRVVDLEKHAYAALAPLGGGVIPIKIEPMRIATANGLMAGIDTKGIGSRPVIGSKAAFAFDAASGNVLYEKNADQPLPIASLSKIIAVRVFLDTRPTLSTVVSYSIQDEKLNHQYVDHPWEAAKLNVKDGETMTIEDLIYSALVGSANNAIESLVRVSGLSRDEFLRRMNAFASQRGHASVFFDDPTGLSPKNVAAARDFAFLASEAFGHPMIQKASTMERYSFSTINTKKAHVVRNTDRLLVSEPLNFTGSKTGYLHEAGYCLVVAITTDAGPLVAITLGDESNASSVQNMKTLLYFSKQKIYQQKGDPILTLKKQYVAVAP